MKTDRTQSLSEVNASVDTQNKKGFFRKLFAFAGPAYLVSVGYMDPGNWATDIAGGSGFGYSLLWVLLMSNLIALLLQSLSARLGLVRGLDLAQASREAYPGFINWFLYGLAEIAIAATDLAEVLGMAIGLQLLFDIPLMTGILISVLDTFLLLFLLHYGIRKMEAFIISLVAIVGFSFFMEMFFAQPDATEVVKGLIPSLPGGEALYIAIGIIGATVMPHNLYLHSALVQSRKFERNEIEIKKAIKFNFIDSAVALNLAFLVNAAILILAATAFFNNGLNEVAEIQDAHRLLEPMLGTQWAPILFAVALIAAGQSSTITGTLAGQIVMEGYLNLRIQPWVRRIITRVIAIVPSLIAIHWMGEQATGRLLILSQVILSMQLGFAVIPLIHSVSDRKKMGAFTLKLKWKILAWISAAIIVSLNLKLVIEQISLLHETFPEHALLINLTVIPFSLFAGFALLYITFKPFMAGTPKEISFDLHSHDAVLDNLSKRSINHIAVAVDFSAADASAMRHALTEIDKGKKITLLHINESAGALILGGDIMDKESETDMVALQKYALRLQGLGYEVETKLGFGTPVKEITKMVETCGAEMLVMATHGHKGWKDTLFGTTVDKVRHSVKVPVVIVSGDR
jgi:manganese transport protein